MYVTNMGNIEPFGDPELDKRAPFDFLEYTKDPKVIVSAFVTMEPLLISVYKIKKKIYDVLEDEPLKSMKGQIKTKLAGIQQNLPKEICLPPEGKAKILKRFDKYKKKTTLENLGSYGLYGMLGLEPIITGNIVGQFVQLLDDIIPECGKKSE